jgi:aspartyl protease family protein
MSGALDPGEQARLFYLVLLGLVVLAGIFARYRGRMGQGLQHAAIWVLIFMGAMIVYGFRDVLREAAVPSEMLVQDGRTVVLRRGADAHFHATLRINGRDIRFLVDTGATQMVLSQADARRAGLDTGRLIFSIPAATANGTIFSAPVTLSEVTLGPFTDRDVPAMVNGGPLPTSLLGMRYIDRFRRVSVEGDRMILER